MRNPAKLFEESLGMPKEVFFSPEGLERSKKALADMREQLALIRTEKSSAYTLTGYQWHDNPTWNRLEQDEARKLKDIFTLEDTLANSKIFTPPVERNTTAVALGAIVEIEREEERTGRREKALWEIVPYGDTNVREHKIAYDAPLAVALNGLCVGEETEMDSPNGKVYLSILALYKNREVIEKAKLVVASHKNGKLRL